MKSPAIYEKSIRSFLLPIVPLLDDEGVSEILVNGPHEVICERSGKLEKSAAQFADHLELGAAITHLAQFVGKHLSPENPILEGRLPDGSRVEAIIPPAAPHGPFLAIRRFSRATLTMDDLVGKGSLDRDQADMLKQRVQGKSNILVSGGTGSGKTSLLNALSGFVPEGERVLILEDAMELQLQHHHVVSLEAQPPNKKGGGAVTIRDLLHASLRLRPDRIVVGELRGAEAMELVQAMTTGHGGCMSTIHASGPRHALRRMEVLSLMSDVNLPLVALREQIASSIDLVVQVSRLPCGRRAVIEATSVKGLDEDGHYRLTQEFRRKSFRRRAPQWQQ